MRYNKRIVVRLSNSSLTQIKALKSQNKAFNLSKLVRELLNDNLNINK